MRALSLFFAALLLLGQVIKGLSLKVSLYPLLGYIFTYADGPVRRALLPSVLAVFGATDLAAIGRVLAYLHFVMIAVLAGVLLARLAQLQFPADRARRWLLWLFMASAVVPVLAATAGYFDVFMVLGLIAMATLLADGFIITAGLLLLAMSLQHEMVLVPGFCLMLAEALLHEANRQRCLKVMAGVAVVAIGWLAFTAHMQPQLLPLAELRCGSLRPATHPLVVEVWDGYCVRQARATLASDFTPWRLLVVPFFLMVYGLFPLVLLTGGVVQSRRLGSWWRALALLALMAAPCALITIAWDTDRMILLASVSAWLILDRWLQLQPPVLPRASTVVVAALVLFQAALFYPAIDAYGQQRVLPPQLARSYLIDPRGWVLPMLEHYKLTVPVFLKRETCIDSRCAG